MKVPKLRFKDDDGRGFPEWEDVTIGDLITNKSIKYNPETFEKSFKCIELEHLSQGTGELLGFVDSRSQKSIKNKFHKGEVLFGKLRPYLKKYLKTPFDGVCSTEIWVLTGKTVSNDFVYQFIQTENFVTLANKASGSKMPRADWNVVASGEAKYPVIAEQTKIANFLTAIDEKITQLTQKCDLLAQYKKGAMQQIFSQKLRFKDDDGREFPEWEETALNNVADEAVKWSFTGGPFGSNLKAEDYTEKGIRIIQLQNIGDGVFNDSYKIYTSEKKANELLSCNIYPDEIIISKMGDPVARCCFIPSNESRYVMASDGIRLAVNKSFFNAKYIHDFINSETFRKNALEASTGSTRRRIGLDELKKLPITYPCFLEQTKIANFLTAIDNKITQAQTQLDAVKRYKKGLLQQMFV